MVGKLDVTSKHQDKPFIGEPMQKNEDFTPLLVNAATAAKLLGISERNLWQQKKEGNIPYIKIGKLTKYHIPTILKWIDDNTQNGDED